MSLEKHLVTLMIIWFFDSRHSNNILQNLIQHDVDRVYEMNGYIQTRLAVNVIKTKYVVIHTNQDLERCEEISKYRSVGTIN